MKRHTLAMIIQPAVGKTGEISNARNDAAIVRGPGRQYVLVVYMQLPGGQAKPIIQKIASAVDALMTPAAK